MCLGKLATNKLVLNQLINQSINNNLMKKFRADITQQ